MTLKPLTYEELISLALEHYEKGGDGVYECWDESAFNEYVNLFGPIYKKDALKMFYDNYEIRKDFEATIW